MIGSGRGWMEVRRWPGPTEHGKEIKVSINAPLRQARADTIMELVETHPGKWLWLNEETLNDFKKAGWTKREVFQAAEDLVRTGRAKFGSLGKNITIQPAD